MTDYFELLGVARRPWLDPEEVKGRFLSLSTSAHPDRAHQGAEAEKARATEVFTLLNNAQQCLRETVPRLRHLLELESGAVPGDVREIPAESIDLFVEVAKKCRDTDAFIQSRGEQASPMLMAQSFSRGLDWLDELQKLRGRLNGKREAVEKELTELNDAWVAAPPPGNPARRTTLPLDRLERLYRTSSFLARANRQMEERMQRLGV